MIYFAVAVIIFMMVWREYISHLDRQESKARERDLMNRLMAKHFGEYVQGVKNLEAEALTQEERLKGLNLADKQFGNVLPVD